MKKGLVLVWLAMLFVCTCTGSLSDLLIHGQASFAFVRTPSFGDLWKIYDATYNDPFWVVQKTGHAIGFGMLYVISMFAFKSNIKALIIAIGFACLTEMAQLYFGRHGRVLDMLIDSSGIALFCLMFHIRFFWQKKIRAASL